MTSQIIDDRDDTNAIINPSSKHNNRKVRRSDNNKFNKRRNNKPNADNNNNNNTQISSTDHKNNLQNLIRRNDPRVAASIQLRRELTAAMPSIEQHIDLSSVSQSVKDTARGFIDLLEPFGYSFADVVDLVLRNTHDNNNNNDDKALIEQVSLIVDDNLSKGIQIHEWTSTGKQTKHSHHKQRNSPQTNYASRPNYNNNKQNFKPKHRRSNSNGTNKNGSNNKRGQDDKAQDRAQDSVKDRAQDRAQDKAQDRAQDKAQDRAQDSALNSVQRRIKTTGSTPEAVPSTAGTATCTKPAFNTLAAAVTIDKSNEKAVTDEESIKSSDKSNDKFSVKSTKSSRSDAAVSWAKLVQSGGGSKKTDLPAMIEEPIRSEPLPAPKVISHSSTPASPAPDASPHRVTTTPSNNNVQRPPPPSSAVVIIPPSATAFHHKTSTTVVDGPAMNGMGVLIKPATTSSFMLGERQSITLPMHAVASRNELAMNLSGCKFGSLFWNERGLTAEEDRLDIVESTVGGLNNLIPSAQSLKLPPPSTPAGQQHNPQQHNHLEYLMYQNNYKPEFNNSFPAVRPQPLQQQTSGSMYVNDYITPSVVGRNGSDHSSSHQHHHHQQQPPQQQQHHQHQYDHHQQYDRMLLCHTENATAALGQKNSSAVQQQYLSSSAAAAPFNYTTTAASAAILLQAIPTDNRTDSHNNHSSVVYPPYMYATRPNNHTFQPMDVCFPGDQQHQLPQPTAGFMQQQISATAMAAIPYFNDITNRNYQTCNGAESTANVWALQQHHHASLSMV